MAKLMQQAEMFCLAVSKRPMDATGNGIGARTSRFTEYIILTQQSSHSKESENERFFEVYCVVINLFDFKATGIKMVFN